MDPAQVADRLRSFTASPAGKDRREKSKGSALLATLCFAAILSLSLGSFLALCYRSLVLSNRNLQSTHGIELAEVGMEEALWTLNNNAFGDGTWTFSSPSGVPTATKVLIPGFSFENGVTGQVVLTVSNYGKTVSDFTTASTFIMTITARGIITLADTTTVTRTLQSNVQPAQLFTNAIGATGNVNFAGSGTVDSYNSSAGPYVTVTAGSLTATNSAAVVSGATVDIGNTQVFGFAATGGSVLQDQPGAYVIGPSTPSGTHIDLSRVSLSATQPLFDVPTPSAVNLFDPTTGFTQLTSDETLSTPGSYHYDSIMLDGSKVLTIDAPVTLTVTNFVYVGLGSQIHVTTNGSLQLEIASTTHSTDARVSNPYSLPQGLYLVSDGGIVNESLLPQNVSVLVGGPISTDPSPQSYSYINSTTPFYGRIYLPNDTINIDGSNFTLYGAVVAKNVVFTNSVPAIHYDLALQKVGIPGTTPLALVQLREI